MLVAWSLIPVFNYAQSRRPMQPVIGMGSRPARTNETPCGPSSPAPVVGKAPGVLDEVLYTTTVGQWFGSRVV